MMVQLTQEQYIKAMAAGIIPQQNSISSGAQEAIPSVKDKKSRKPRKLPKVLSQKQIDRLFSKINIECRTGLRNRAVYETMLQAGLRVSEVCNLVPANIDFDEDMIHVQNGKGGVDRNVPMKPDLKEWLLRWNDKRHKPSPYFFCAVAIGSRLIPRYLNATLKRLCEQTDTYLQDGTEKVLISCHKLRHTCATRWLTKDKLSLPEIQRLLGHTHINATMIYLSVSMDDIKEKFLRG